MKIIFKISVAAAAFYLFSQITGCGLFSIGLDNLGRTVFSSPDESKSNVKNPVNPDVKLSALWIGHSSVLLQIYDRVILIDPVFNDVISGVMTRKQTAAFDINTLPKLDLILVSHAHMDHLSISTLSDLEDKFAGAKLVFPEGAEEFMPGYNFEFVRLKTGNSSKKNYTGGSKNFDSLKVTAVYALHFGGRFGLDSYLWNMPGCTGFIIEYKDITVFYAGDTAYEEIAFKKLGEKFDIDLALIPIGPCKDCEELTNFNHVTSLGALQMFDDLKADKMLPVHFGALSYRRDPDYPLEVLKELIAMKDNSGALENVSDLYKDKVVILDEGEQHVFKYIND